MVSIGTGPIRIADALFGKTRQRVLALLFGATKRRVFLRQIARQAGTGLGSVQREVARMAEAGLLIREREGHQVYYQANPDSPVINELRRLMLKTGSPNDANGGRPRRRGVASPKASGANNVDILESVVARRADILAAASRRGARHVRLFGSVVRGEARSDSDVDFLVDLDRGRSLLDLGGLLMDLESILGRKVDVVTPAGLRPRVRASVLRDARPL
jgi:predicted nucleotidyltransferase